MAKAEYPGDGGCPQRDSAEHEEYAGARSIGKQETEEVDGMIEKLQTELETCDPMKIVAQMKAIVPEFKSNNSIFSQLD